MCASPFPEGTKVRNPSDHTRNETVVTFLTVSMLDLLNITRNAVIRFAWSSGHETALWLLYLLAGFLALNPSRKQQHPPDPAVLIGYQDEKDES